MIEHHVGSWYRREDYDRIREIMDDGPAMPATFDEWEKIANKTIAQAKTQGVVIKPVIIDPVGFVAFCEAKKIPRGSKERTEYVVSKDAGLI
jgi:hypothetical protein